MVYNNKTCPPLCFFPSLGKLLGLLDLMAQGGHARVIAVQDRASGLRGWIALHNTSRGPAYGGIRVWPYRDENAAMMDALRLSRAMTWKCALAGVPGGGAKTVILSDRLINRSAAMARLGEIIEDLGGTYRCGPDVGFVEADQVALASTTQHLAHHMSGLRASGEATSDGIIYGMRTALKFLDGDEKLKSRKVAIQGLGAVGLALSKKLIAAGCEVFGADSNPDAAAIAGAAGVKLVDPAKIYELKTDIFSPCALGGVLHDLTIKRLGARIVVGAANNTLARTEHAQMLFERKILYVPDFVVNSGALIEGVGYEQTGNTNFSSEIRNIGTTVSKILELAKSSDCIPRDAALRLAREVLSQEQLSAKEMGEDADCSF